MPLETKQKISDTQKSRKIIPWNKGMPTRDDVKEKISKKLKGKVSNRKGCKVSDEQKRKISETLKLTWAKRKNKKHEQENIIHN